MLSSSLRASAGINLQEPSETYPKPWTLGHRQVIACERCGRSGRYSRERLIARFGADAALPMCCSSWQAVRGGLQYDV
jgi:hypothetical protein